MLLKTSANFYNRIIVELFVCISASGLIRIIDAPLNLLIALPLSQYYPRKLQ